MGQHIVIIGGLASGKTTLAKYLEEVYGYKRIVTYTTRPIRKGEVEGKDYHFVDEVTFYKLMNAEFFFETTHYTTADGVWSYGSQISEYKEFERTIIVLNPSGAMLLKEPSFFVWLDIPLKVRMYRALERGDDPLEVARRLLADANDFSSKELELLVESSGIRVTEPIELEDLAEYITYNLEEITSYLQGKKEND